MSSSTLYFDDQEWSQGFWRFLIVCGAHLLVFTGLFYYQSVRAVSSSSPGTITVRLLAPPAPEIVQPTPEPPKPVVKKAVEVPKRLLAVQTQAPAVFTAPPPVAEPVPPPPSAPTAPAVAAEPIINPKFEANYLNNPISYPQASRRAGEQGKVMLRVLVSTDGLPQQIELGKSSGFERLDRAAMEAVRRWKFIPARQGPVAVVAWANVPIIFSLTSDTN